MLPVLALLLASPPGAPQMRWIEAQCSGGIRGGLDRVRVTATGRVIATHHFGEAPVEVSRIASGDAARLSRRLDAIDFDHLKTRPARGTVYDGVNCSLARSINGLSHQVRFLAGADPAGASAREKAAVVVMRDLLRLGSKASLNPQPIPPREDGGVDDARRPVDR